MIIERRKWSAAGLATFGVPPRLKKKANSKRTAFLAKESESRLRILAAHLHQVFFFQFRVRTCIGQCK